MNEKMYLVIGLVIFIPSMIAFIYNYAGWVYLDAKSRGMKPGFWTVISLSGQNMSGFFIYLISRKGKRQMETTEESMKVKKAAVSFILTFLGICFCMIYIVMYMKR